MLRTRAVEVSLWEAVLPDEVLRMPEELARVDALLDDPAFFAPFVPFFDPRLGRPSTPMEVYLRLMFLKFRYRLGYESLCREVRDSITWRRFCRIPLDGRVPHPTTLMKLTTRCGTAAVDGCNEALLAKAAEAKLLHTTRLRADITVVAADMEYPTDSGLLVKAVRRIAAAGRRVRPPAGPPAPGFATAAARPAGERARSGPSCGCAPRRPATKPRPRSAGSPASWPGWPSAPPPRPRSCWSTPAGRRRGRLRLAVNDLTDLLDATRQIAAQTRQRLAGTTPDGATRRVSLHDGDARPIAKGRLGRPVEFGPQGPGDRQRRRHRCRPHRRTRQPARRTPARARGRPGHPPHRAAPAHPHRRPAATARPGSRTSCTSSGCAPW
jgi:IS5 family transposase